MNVINSQSVFSETVTLINTQFYRKLPVHLALVFTMWTQL